MEMCGKLRKFHVCVYEIHFQSGGEHEKEEEEAEEQTRAAFEGEDGNSMVVRRRRSVSRRECRRCCSQWSCRRPMQSIQRWNRHDDTADAETQKAGSMASIILCP